jgi:hypothetical protein
MKSLLSFLYFFFLTLSSVLGITYLEGPESLALGMTPVQAIQSFGAPHSMYIQPGPAEWQQDIVFYYSDHSYLYWFNNRVWQVRFDRRHGEPIFGISMASSLSRVRNQLGEPLFESESELIYPVVERGFPLRARFIFEDTRLIEVFIYRSDF